LGFPRGLTSIDCMGKVFTVYREDTDRWFCGDRMLRKVARRMLRPRPTHLSGMQRVVHNFLTGLQAEGRPFSFNPSRRAAPRGSKIISFGLGRLGVEGVSVDSPVIAAIGFPHPADAIDLFKRFDVRVYLQHSQWVLDWVASVSPVNNVKFGLWHAGIDTDEWCPPSEPTTKNIDILIYYKIHWDQEYWDRMLVDPIKRELERRGLNVHQIDYGAYAPAEYRALLSRSRGMLFLGPHETQGFAYQESLSCGVPVLAWEPGYWLDPIRFNYGTDVVPATSVPFFDDRCGLTFRDAEEFGSKLDEFYEKCRQKLYQPRRYVMDNLTIAGSTRRMLEFYDRI